jgi:predicted NUDIX family NTP pyrophosphohydrolase
MGKVSAGLLMYRRTQGNLEFLLVHPGGPFWKNKDAGAWTIPKGELLENEEPLTAALREFREELGFRAAGTFHPLRPIRQKGGKLIHAWAFEGNCDPRNFKSNTFDMEWPPRSGKSCSFPEIDKAEFFSLSLAREKINPAQIDFLEEVCALPVSPTG